MAASVQHLTPESIPERPRKRRRKVLACNDCRRRKVQCDRGMPVCNRCDKNGRATHCIYEDDNTIRTATSVEDEDVDVVPSMADIDTHSQQSLPRGVVTVSKSVWDDMMERLSRQERRIAKLEAEQRSADSLPSRGEGERPSAFISDGSKECVVIRGKGFKTQLYGSTDPRSLLAPVHDLPRFARTAMEKSPGMKRRRKDLEAWDRVKKDMNKSRALDPTVDLLSLVPGQAETDRLVALYLAQLEPVYSILHVPSFHDEYARFWKDRADSAPSFVCLLLLLVACVRCLDIEEPWTFIACSSKARETAIHSIEACEAWFLRQSVKHVTLANFQIRCLLLVAKRMNACKTKRMWTDTGSLLSHLMSVGFHRSPDLITKTTSEFDKEMRRRIWALAVELDLQASLDRGMLPHSDIMLADCEAPRNLDDEDVETTMSSLPLSKSPAMVTKATYLNASARSLPLRKALARELNGSRRHLTIRQAMAYTHDVEQELQCVRQYQVEGDKYAGPAVSLLSMQLQQMVCMIYASAVQRNGISAVEQGFAIMAFTTAARSLIKLHEDLATNGNHALLIMRNDISRVALSSAPVASSTIACSEGVGDSGQLLCVLEKARNLMELKMYRHGILAPSDIFAFAAYDVVRNKGDPMSTATTSWPGVDQFVTLSDKVWSAQDPTFEDQVSVRKGAEAMSALKSTTDGVSESTITSAGDLLLDDLRDFDFDDWMFDSTLYTDQFFLPLEGAGSVIP